MADPRTPKKPVVPPVPQGPYSPLFKVAEGAGNFLSALPKWGSLTIIAYFAKDALETAATTTGLAAVAGSLLGTPTTTTMLGIGIGTLGVAYGLFERRERQKQIQQDGLHRQTVEAALDPGRTSSGLAANGSSNPADR